jgi:hypothetical protein
VLEITPDGVFVIRNGVVAKFAVGLGTAAGTKELFPALPEPPKLSEAPTPEEREAMGKWMGLLAERTAAFSVLAREKMLYLVVGTKFFRVNQQTLAVEAQADLMPAPEGLRRGVNTEAPLLKLDGGVLYVLSGQAFIAVDAQTGAVQTRMTLPKEMFPTANIGNVMRGGNNGPGGGNRNGGGGAGGMRGEGGGAPAGNGRNAVAPAPRTAIAAAMPRLPTPAANAKVAR